MGSELARALVLVAQGERSPEWETAWVVVNRALAIAVRQVAGPPCQHADLEDILARAGLRLLRSGKFNGSTDAWAYAYLKTVAWRACVDYWRRLPDQGFEPWELDPSDENPGPSSVTADHEEAVLQLAVMIVLWPQLVEHKERFDPPGAEATWAELLMARFSKKTDSAQRRLAQRMRVSEPRLSRRIHAVLEEVKVGAEKIRKDLLKKSRQHKGPQGQTSHGQC